VFTRALGLLALAVAIAAAAAAAANSTPARTPVVSRFFKAEFGVGIDVTWSRDTGTRAGPCSTWAHEEGVYEISARSIGEIPPGKKVGSFIHPINSLQGLDQEVVWAIFNAGGGKAEVHMKRALTQQGQTNACYDKAAVPVEFPPNDCGAREYVSRTPVLRPTHRDSFRTLEDILEPPGDAKVFKALAIDAQAQQLLYKRCSVPIAPFPVGIHNFALPVTEDHIRKLRNAKVGQRVRIELFVKTPRKCMPQLEEGETCTFELDAHVDITRVKPPR
jgi:hypothetical protein